MKKIFALLLVLFLTCSLSAKGGDVDSLLLEKFNLAEMQEMGFQLTATDVYDTDNPSMKDAVVVFGGVVPGE